MGRVFLLRCFLLDLVIEEHPPPNSSSVRLGTESLVSLRVGMLLGFCSGTTKSPLGLYKRPCQAPPGTGPYLPTRPLGDSEE